MALLLIQCITHSVALMWLFSLRNHVLKCPTLRLASFPAQLLCTDVLLDGLGFNFAAYLTQEFNFQVSELVMLL